MQPFLEAVRAVTNLHLILNVVLNVSRQVKLNVRFIRRHTYMLIIARMYYINIISLIFSGIISLQPLIARTSRAPNLPAAHT